MKKIVLTGGGTAGHVTPNLALIPRLVSLGYEIHYIGSYDGIERKLVEDYGIPYYGISTGKLRRYFDVKNFTDPFRVIKGFSEAKQHLKAIKPDIIFSKGGYVSVPVVRAASSLKIPCVIHESDMTPGLANKLCIPVATKICCNFPETIKELPDGKAVVTGSPIRAELLSGGKEKGKSLCGFTDGKPVAMVIGGSLGAANVNTAVRAALPKLLEEFNVVHICGKGKLDESLSGTPGYVQFEYVKEDLKHLFAMADVVISRAGANAICELLALRKPNLLIPLGLNASRGDQILNAKSFESQGFSMLLMEEDIKEDTIPNMVHELYENRDRFIENMSAGTLSDPVMTITGILEETLNK